MGKSENIFKFRKNDHIGVASAEQDTEFLRQCFVDTGELALLQDLEDHHHIVLGRTGSGKSALLWKLKEQNPESVIEIEPDNLALTYVSNSTILQFFSGLGVNLDPFFKLLWRHVLTVELLNRHFSDDTSTNQNGSIFARLSRMFGGDSRKDRELREAINYLKTWGSSFWEATEFRVKEITQKVEDSLQEKATLKVGGHQFSLGVEGSQTSQFSEQQKAELIKRGQNVISEAQVQDLHKVLKLLDAVLENKQRRYYIVIDGLDENWVEERLRYRLIMALVVTAREFAQVRHAKVILALRRDLIERVFRLTRDSGFQEEKYQSLYLPLTWTKPQLLQVLDKRINKLVAKRYTKEAVTHKDFLPKEFQKIPISDYICSVAPRPRDIIAFFNYCIATAPDMARLTQATLKDAEGMYSRSRLQALADEWIADYPFLLDFVRILYRKSPSFKIATITNREIEDLCLTTVINHLDRQDLLLQNAMLVVDLVTAAREFRILLMQVFYRIGLIGIKLTSHEKESWVDEYGRSISAAEITDEVSVVVHPAYHRVMGISTNR